MAEAITRPSRSDVRELVSRHGFVEIPDSIWWTRTTPDGRIQRLRIVVWGASGRTPKPGAHLTIEVVCSWSEEWEAERVRVWNEEGPDAVSMELANVSLWQPWDAVVSEFDRDVISMLD